MADPLRPDTRPGSASDRAPSSAPLRGESAPAPEADAGRTRRGSATGWRPQGCVDVVIPARDEEASLPGVLAEIPGYVRCVVVTDNGSRDATARVAREAGAHVVAEPRPGYGRACQRALRELRHDPPDVVVFLDADHSDRPQEMARLLEALQEAPADLVIGSRTLGDLEPGALTPPQRFGNALACALLRWGYGTHCTDLGPFRAIRWQALQRLGMRDPDYGWTVEMQIKAARLGLRSVEVPVSYRRRAGGESKVSGTLRGTVGAGTKILWLLWRHAARPTWGAP